MRFQPQFDREKLAAGYVRREVRWECRSEIESQTCLPRVSVVRISVQKLFGLDLPAIRSSGSVIQFAQKQRYPFLSHCNA